MTCRLAVLLSFNAVSGGVWCLSSAEHRPLYSLGKTPVQLNKKAYGVPVH